MQNGRLRMSVSQYRVCGGSFDLSAEDEAKIASLRIAPVPLNERRRMRILRQSFILNTPREDVYDRYTSLAARYFKVPMAMISLIDIDRAWLKSRVGTDIDEGPRDHSFCSFTVLEETPKVMVVLDASKDPRFCNNPHVLNTMGVKFYAGCSIEVEGVKLGSFCIVDSKPRSSFGSDEENLLKDMGTIVEDLIIARRRKFLGVENEQARLISLALSDLHAPLQKLRDAANSLESRLCSGRREQINKLHMKDIQDFHENTCQLREMMEKQLKLAVLLTYPISSSPPSCHTITHFETMGMSRDNEYVATSEKWLYGLIANAEASNVENRDNEGFLMHPDAHHFLSLFLPLLDAHYNRCGKVSNGIRMRVDVVGLCYPITNFMTADSQPCYIRGEVTIIMSPHDGQGVDDKDTDGLLHDDGYEEYLVNLLQGVRVGGMRVARVLRDLRFTFPCVFAPLAISPSHDSSACSLSIHLNSPMENSSMASEMTASLDPTITVNVTDNSASAHSSLPQSQLSPSASNSIGWQGEVSRRSGRGRRGLCLLTLFWPFSHCYSLQQHSYSANNRSLSLPPVCSDEMCQDDANTGVFHKNSLNVPTWDSGF